MTPLSVEQFDDFYTEVRSRPGAQRSPFPWQRRLVAALAADRRFPALLDLPTGAGKTSMLEIAVFLLALQADTPPSRRFVPRRILFVVDRRTVVAQSHRQAIELALALEAPGADRPVTRIVAERLRAYAADGPVLRVAQLRGGMPRETDWATRPDQPTILLSTVDQVGSRLLFSGYGVSDSMAPVHAGLLGVDCLYLLDEVHLAVPFETTLTALADRWRAGHPGALDTPFAITRLTATPRSAESSAFRLDEADASHPLLSRRLRANRSARCEVVPTKDRRALLKRIEAVLVEELPRAVGAVGASACVAVVLHRVDDARRLAASLRARLKETEVILVTGRMRPLDRTAVDERLARRAGCGRSRVAGTIDGDSGGDLRPCVVVATPCIEAGADLDFDALVTEVPSLDALRQRVGRVNRLGELEASSIVVVGLESPPEDDPVYGTALAATWAWLRTLGESFSLGIDTCPQPSDDVLPTLLPPAPPCPVLLPAHLDLWSQTSPRPVPQPEVSLWLHGARVAMADVSVVWRVDLERPALDGLDPDAPLPDWIAECIAVAPPSALEALSLPINAVRRWLRSQSEEQTFEAESAPAPETGTSSHEEGRVVLRWAGPESPETRLVRARDLRPGDTLIVPSDDGGLLADGTWEPASTEPVRDLGDACQWHQRRRATLRLHPALLGHRALPATLTRPSEIDEPTPWAEVSRLLAEVRSAGPVDPWVDALAAEVESRRRPRLISADLAPGIRRYSLVSRRLAGRADAESTTEGSMSAHTGVEVPLDGHLMDVGEVVRGFAERCGLPPARVADLVLAARLHDVGKADPTFQKWLRGGDPVRAMAGEPLAKSAVPAWDPAAVRRARERSGYPAGGRHEFLSVVLAQSDPRVLAEAADPELVLHLIASHHGHARPFAPVVEHPDLPVRLEWNGLTLGGSTRHGQHRLDSGVASRFWALQARYGWHGLAWLEAILRLADHAQSAREASGVRGNP